MKTAIAALTTVVVAGTVAGYLHGDGIPMATTLTSNCTDPIYPPPPSPSIAHVFRESAVCTDSPVCSRVGRRILKKNGTAVDAAIAALFCNGLLNHQSMGLGGGFFMTVYIKEEGKAYSLIARETAPTAATKNMYDGQTEKSIIGSLAVGVPGEMRGYWAAHKRWGRLPWKTLVEPTIEFCNSGYPISQPLFDAFGPLVKNDTNLRKTYVNPKTGEFLNVGDIAFPTEELCSTLRRIADNGGDELYNGTLADDFLADLQSVGSIITAEDLKNYRVKFTEPIAFPLNKEDTMYTAPPPGGGVVLSTILNILAGYKFNASSINTTEDQILTYHRILEAFKHAFGMRSKLGDPDFLNLKNLIYTVLNPYYGNWIREHINDDFTSNNSWIYELSPRGYITNDDGGTAHISIKTSNGDAVSVTSSINMFFGASFSTLKTGIVMNNVMNDFSLPGAVNDFHFKPSPANFIMPRKRPLSSMSPSIIVNSNGNVKMVVGASGGTKIITGLVLVLLRKLWFNQTIKQAIDAPRLHHQLYPMRVQYECGNTKAILKGLRDKGHGLVRYKERGSIVCAMLINQTGIYANADFRKGGDVSGD